MDSKTKKKLIYSFIVLLIILTIIFLGITANLIIAKDGDKIKSINQAYLLEKYVEENNLRLPLPIFNYEHGEIFKDNEHLYVDAIYERNLTSFHELIIKSYYYDKDSYDCKYWTYVWMLYWKHNKDKYNWEMELVDTNNHIFLMVYNESGYCILDETEVTCNGFNV